MPPLHPLIVHFPIALYCVAVLFDGISTFTRKSTLHPATRVLMALSFLGTGAAILTGDWLKNARAKFLPHSLLFLHESLAIAFGAWLFILLLLRLRKSWRPSWTYLSLAGVGVLLLVLVGHTGGSMAWPSAPPVAVSHN